MALIDDSSLAAFLVPIADVVKRELAEFAKKPVIPKVWLDPREASQYLRLHEVTLANWRRQKRGPRWHRLNRKFIRYRISDLDSWVASGAGSTGAA